MYFTCSFHLVDKDTEPELKPRRISKIEKLARSVPAPAVDQTHWYCEDCNLNRHIRFRKTFVGNIKASTSCCHKVLGYFDFPPSERSRLDRKVYVAWLNE